jgi:acetyl esterase/lipase
MRSGRRLTLALGAALALSISVSGCTTLYFGIANVPSYFSGIHRTAGLPYGSDARQRLDVYQPAASRGASPASVPVIVFWYGGSWDDGARQDYRFVGTALARLGYVVVIPDYRLYPHVRFPLFLDDAAQAVTWVERNIGRYGGNEHRLILMGHSAGAYMAAMLALNRSYLQAADADPERIVALVGLSGPYGLIPNTAVLNDIFSAPFTPHDWQVLPYASSQAPPTLLLHGGADRLVWTSNSQDLAAALRSHGVQVETRIYPDRGHIDMLAAVSVPGRWRAPVLADIAAFLNSIDPSDPVGRPGDLRPPGQP